MFRYLSLISLALLGACAMPGDSGKLASSRFVFVNQGTTVELDAADQTAEWAVQQLAARTGVPREYILLYRRSGRMFEGARVADAERYSTLLGMDDRLGSGEIIDVAVRPVTGDHIHSLYSIWIHDGAEYRLVRPLYDDELQHTNKASDGETAYYFQKLHNGLHTHGKGLIHVHPWTSPLWFHETDGLGATLKNWLDDVGVKIRKPPYRSALSLEFGNGVFFISKAEFAEIVENDDESKTTLSYGEKFAENKLGNEEGRSWKVLHWKHYLDFEPNTPPEVITEEVGELWLGRNLSVTILVYGPEADVVENASDFATTVIDTTLRADMTEVVNVKLAAMKKNPMYLTLRQFDGRRYPSPSADDDRYLIEDERYPLRDQGL